MPREILGMLLLDHVDDLQLGVVLSRDQERPKEVSGRNDSGGASR